MSNIHKIIGREYWTRVKKKSFIVMTLLAPVLIVGLYAGLIGLAFYAANQEGESTNTILVNESDFIDNIPDTASSIKFTAQMDNLDSALVLLRNDEADAVLFIDSGSLFEPVKANFYTKDGSDASQERMIEKQLESLIAEKKKAALNFKDAQLDSLTVNLTLVAKTADKSGIKASNSTIKGIIGLVATFMIYFFIFMFAVQVMRGVMEEKTNRIVEVVISTVKPYELMFGKIVGIALVGLTQFMIWIVLTGILLLVGNVMFAASMIDFSSFQAGANPMGAEGANMENMGMVSELIMALGDMPWAKIIVTFFGFFIGGYLLYSSIFAAIGSSVDAETDTQQFMLPVSLPLILGIVIAQSIAFTNPHSSLAFWSSMIPFTSPIVIVVRACFDAPWWEIILSMTILYATFFLLVRIVGKIYRIGILTYGKKPTWKQLFKWIVTKS